jgi:hypothetical protein
MNIEFPIKEEGVKKLIKGYKSEKRLCYRDTIKLICNIEIIYLKQESSIINIETPKNGKVIIVGDLHGQLKDLLKIIDENGILFRYYKGYQIKKNIIFLMGILLIEVIKE